MLEFYVFQVAEWLRYVILAPIMLFQGPIGVVLGSFLASQGYLNVFLVYVTATLVDFGGDLLYYVLGHFGRRHFLKYGSFFGINQKRMAFLEKSYNDHAGKIFVIGKWTQSLGFAVLIGAGLASVPFKKYLSWSVLSALPKIILLVVLGYYFGQSFREINNALNIVGIGSALLVVLAIPVIYLLYKKHQGKML